MNGNGSIEFNKCTISNNTLQDPERGGRGGGMNIYSHRNASIEFYDCTVSNNTAQGGGGVYILSNNCSIKFNNYNIFNNTSQDNQEGGGGGLYINSENGSIEFSNSIIYNNTVYIGSGMLIGAQRLTSTTRFLFTNISFHFNQISDRNDVYQSAVVLVNIYDVVLNILKLVIMTQLV